jgi:hypothetical protein
MFLFGDGAAPNAPSFTDLEGFQLAAAAHGRDRLRRANPPHGEAFWIKGWFLIKRVIRLRHSLLGKNDRSCIIPSDSL